MRLPPLRPHHTPTPPLRDQALPLCPLPPRRKRDWFPVIVAVLYLAFVAALFVVSAAHRPGGCVAIGQALALGCREPR